MNVEQTHIEGVKIIHQFRADDNRGSFIKTFHASSFQQKEIDFKLKESFYSISRKDVIRGMHFHHPPYEHDKIVFCTLGNIIDVALDLRKQSATYGQCVASELSSENNKALFIPKGCAHGFLTLTDNATTFYFVNGEYQKEADDGILFNSFGFDWNVDKPIVSERDLSFETLQNFNSPF